MLMYQYQRFDDGNLAIDREERDPFEPLGIDFDFRCNESQWIVPGTVDDDGEPLFELDDDGEPVNFEVTYDQDPLGYVSMYGDSGIGEVVDSVARYAAKCFRWPLEILLDCPVGFLRGREYNTCNCSSWIVPTFTKPCVQRMYLVPMPGGLVERVISETP